MHTSQVTYHRLYFRNIDKAPNDFARLVDELGMEATDRPDVFDIVFDEGYSLCLDDAIYSLFPENKLDGDPDNYPIELLLSMLNTMARDQGVKLHTNLFTRTAENAPFDTDIQPDELFDLINTLSNGYELIGIYTEWAMFSNKNVYGAHSGGAVVSTREFSLPTTIRGDLAEEIIMKFSNESPEELADFYVDQFIKPRIDHIVSEPFKNAVFDALRRLTSSC